MDDIKFMTTTKRPDSLLLNYFPCLNKNNTTNIEVLDSILTLGLVGSGHLVIGKDFFLTGMIFVIKMPHLHRVIQ